MELKRQIYILIILRTISLLLCTIIVIALQLFPLPIVRLFAAGFDKETAALAAKFIRVSAFSIYFMILINIGSGFLQINNNFLIPAAISLPRNFCIIVSIGLAFYIRVDLLGWGILAAYVAEFLFISPFIIKNNFQPKPYINLKDENIKETLYIAVPIIIGVSVNQIKHIISKSIASTISAGAISALNYASVINIAVQEILVSGIIAVLFADSAAHVANEEHDKVKTKLSKTIDGMIMILLPASAGILILANPIVTIFFNRGNFNQQSVTLTVSTLQFFCLGMLFNSIRDTLIKVFYAYKDTVTTTVTSVIAIILNIVLSLLLANLMGVKGLALASSVSVIFHCIIMYGFLRKKIGDFCLKQTIQTLIKSLTACIFMCFSVYHLYSILSELKVAVIYSLLISVLAGILIYGLFAIILKIQSALDILKRLQKIRLSIKN